MSLKRCFSMVQAMALVVCGSLCLACQPGDFLVLGSKAAVTKASSVGEQAAAATTAPSSDDAGAHQIVVDGSGHSHGRLPVVFYALTEPTGEDIYPLEAGAFALFGVVDSGSTTVRINDVNPLTIEQGVIANANSITGLNWGKSDAGHLNLTQKTRANLRLNGLNARLPDGNVRIAAPGAEHGAQVELTDMVVEPDDVAFSRIGVPAINQLVTHIDNTKLISVPDTSTSGPYINFYPPGAPSIPSADVVLQLEALPAGALERASGADLERLHWLRNVEFVNAGKTVTDRQQAFDFFYDTAAPLTTINQRMADSLGLSAMDASFSCLGGENNGYVLSLVTMFGAEGFYRIENASVCLQPDAVMYGDGLIGANFFDQVQILLDGPAETLGIIDGIVANAMLTLPAHVRAPVSPLDDERIDRERLNSGLSAYYSLDGNAWDAGGNGNHGTVIGPTPAADRQCTPFGAFRYDGREDMISVDHSPSLEFTQGLSIAAWVHPDVRKRQAIIWKGPYVRGPDASPYRLTLGDAGEIIFELRVRSSPLPVQIVKAGYPTGEWFFVVGTFDGASMKLYVDGLLAGTAAVDGPLGQSRAPLLIGTGQNLSMDTFQGRLDDVRIYDRALSSAEVEALYFGPIDEVASAITSADSGQGVEAAKQNRDLTLAVANQTDTPVCMLYISPVGYDGPYVERLCGDYIMPGTMFGYELPPGRYNTLLKDCADNQMLFKGYMDISDSYELTLTDGDLRAAGCQVVNYAGQRYFEEGRFAEALERFDTARTCYRDAAHRLGEGETLNNAAAVHTQQGRYSEALDLLYESLAIASSVENLDGESAALNTIARINVDLGRIGDALDASLRVLEIRRELNDLAGEGTLLNNIGRIYSEFGRFDKAEQSYREALQVWGKIGDRTKEANTLNNLAQDYVRQDRFGEALVLFNQALEKAREEEDGANPLIESAILKGIGLVHAYERRFSAALGSFDEALALSHEIGDSVGEASLLASRAHVLDDLGRIEEALSAYESAMTLLESVRSLAGGEEERSGFIAQHQDIYQHAVDLYYRQGLYDEAFYLAERARARSFLDLIGNQRVDFRKDAAPELIEREQVLRRQIAALVDAMKSDDDKEALRVLEAQLFQAQGEYEALIGRLKIEAPEYVSLISVNPLTLADVQRQVVDRQTTLIEYFVMDEHILAWIIDAETSEVVDLPISREELNSQVQFLRDAISEKDDERPAAGRLNSGIIAPLMPYVRNNNLIIIPHDVLHYLSFAALWDADRGRYLVEDYTIAYAPSASALSHILEKRNENEGRLLALGDPDDSLDQAANEARTVAQLYGVEPLIGAQATESQFYDQIGNADILHLATHAAFNTQRPLFSGLVLAPDETNDGNLEVHEVFELNLPNINLVVLSACNTALGEQSNGDELVGLTRAFLYAGVPAVVTTQWSIEDRASAALMTAFYRHLREGMTNARALQAAQLQVMAQDEWKTPYYWAAFSLSGDHSGHELADVQK